MRVSGHRIFGLWNAYGLAFSFHRLMLSNQLRWLEEHSRLPVRLGRSSRLSHLGRSSLAQPRQEAPKSRTPHMHGTPFVWTTEP